jgi:glycosyltransferase involved in cell wall biosynthesis
VDVVLPITGLKPYNFEGVNIEYDTYKETWKKIKKADFILSHLDRAGKAFNDAELFKKPYVYVAHNTNRMGIFFHKPQVKKYVIYNSEYVKNTMNYPASAVVVHPPVDGKRYKVRRGSKLTLVNLFERKGSLTFQAIARLMPERDFLGVEGSYGKQEKSLLKNIEYMENTPDMKKVYSKTRILLMPSLYESYGRTAVEAMASGIPVIACPTPGLKECLGEAGIFADSVEEWVSKIKELDDEEVYKEASVKCLKRFKEIEEKTKKELLVMEDFLMDVK